MLTIYPLSPPPSCLLWDVDGTLIDTTTLIVDALGWTYETYFNRNLSRDERRAIIGTPLKAQIRIFGEPEEFGLDPQVVMDGFIHYYEENRHRETILTEVIQVLIDGKRRGYPTALITSKNIPELENTLPRLGIAPYVDFIVSADHVTKPKPDSEGMRLAVSHFGLSVEQIANAVYIGDTTHDIQAGNGGGVRSVGVTWGAATPERLLAENPAALVNTPQELRRLLLGE
ncbi:MAG: HAD family hydrolase [Armatimonadetes bacterium]|nr:HAD family hydrolase [Armatimonadota bacterium]